MKHLDNLSPEDAVAQCLAITDECGAATGAGSFADGYRAAAGDIRRRITVRLGGREATRDEREIRDIEIEARTLARVARLLRREQAKSSSAVARRTLAGVIEMLENGEMEADVVALAPVSGTRVG